MSDQQDSLVDLLRSQFAMLSDQQERTDTKLDELIKRVGGGRHRSATGGRVLTQIARTG